ncbi:hypothetical protein GCM10008955_19480 [Deinococcus malanensis]|uniref:Secreted protein n=1 Tax=Deinococcus malanensis TaxID=1706855 RepID=A0ABQ2EX36_9DEIO|nr:hypothetical protein GCM10008955_19480 [Deinococcus malanensis]
MGAGFAGLRVMGAGPILAVLGTVCTHQIPGVCGALRGPVVLPAHGRQLRQGADRVQAGQGRGRVLLRGKRRRGRPRSGREIRGGFGD